VIGNVEGLAADDGKRQSDYEAGDGEPGRSLRSSATIARCLRFEVNPRAELMMVVMPVTLRAN
jgi:hypothetical protein